MARLILARRIRTGFLLMASIGAMAAPAPNAFSAPATQPGAAKTQTLESKEQNLRFDYPADWTLVKKVSRPNVPLGVLLRKGSAAKPDAQVVLVVTKAADDSVGSLAVLTGAYLARMHGAYQHFKVEENGSGTVAQKHAARAIVTYTEGDTPMRQMLYFVIRGEKAYTFSYVAKAKDFDTQLPIFEAIIKSVSWM